MCGKWVVEINWTRALKLSKNIEWLIVYVIDAHICEDYSPIPPKSEGDCPSPFNFRSSNLAHIFGAQKDRSIIK